MKSSISIIAMKKLFKLSLIVAAAAASIASCQKQETEIEVLEDVKYTFLIGNADETKATIGETCVVWDEGDRIGTFASGATNKYSTVTAATVEAPASFSIYSKGGLAIGSAVYCYYPYASGSVTSDNVPMSIPTSQTEKNSMPMASAPYIVENASDTDNTNYSGEIFFYNLGSVIEFNIYSTTVDYQSENVMSVEFQAEDAIAGSFNFNLTTVDENNLTISGYAEYTVTSSPSTPIQVGADKENAAKVKMVVAPGTHGGTIVVTTDRATYTYSMSEREFGRSRMKPLGINLKIENRVEPDYSGEKLIVGTKAETLYAAKSWVESNNNLKTLEFAFGNDDKVDEAVYPSISDCKMTISKVTEAGDYYGMYTIQDASGKYLYAASSSNNYLRASESIDEESANDYYWAITENGGSYSIVAAKSLNRNVLRYNTSSDLFSCYEDATKQSPVVLYDYSINEDPTPRIYVEKNEYEVAAAATSLAVPFTVNKNITGKITVTVKDEGNTMTDVSCDLGDNVVNVTFEANTTSGSKTATIILSYEGATSVEVAITQAGNTGVTPYTYIFESKQFDENVSVKQLGNLEWTLAGDGGYWGYSSTKGQQFGSGSNPYTNMILSTSGYTEKVNTIKINTSGASDIKASLVVEVNGVQYGDAITLTSAAREYVFTAPHNPVTGEILFTYTQTSAKAIYIKSISINN